MIYKVKAVVHVPMSRDTKSWQNGDVVLKAVIEGKDSRHLPVNIIRLLHEKYKGQLDISKRPDGGVLIVCKWIIPHPRFSKYGTPCTPQAFRRNLRLFGIEAIIRLQSEADVAKVA